MPTVYELIRDKQVETLAEMERRWGSLNFKRYEDPEDCSTFRFFDKLMRQMPRWGK